MNFHVKKTYVLCVVFHIFSSPIRLFTLITGTNAWAYRIQSNHITLHTIIKKIAGITLFPFHLRHTHKLEKKRIIGGALDSSSPLSEVMVFLRRTEWVFTVRTYTKRRGRNRFHIAECIEMQTCKPHSYWTEPFFFIPISFFPFLLRRLGVCMCVRVWLRLRLYVFEQSVQSEHDGYNCAKCGLNLSNVLFAKWKKETKRKGKIAENLRHTIIWMIWFGTDIISSFELHE